MPPSTQPTGGSWPRRCRWDCTGRARRADAADAAVGEVPGADERAAARVVVTVVEQERAGIADDVVAGAGGHRLVVAHEVGDGIGVGSWQTPSPLLREVGQRRAPAGAGLDRLVHHDREVGRALLGVDVAGTAGPKWRQPQDEARDDQASLTNAPLPRDPTALVFGRVRLLIESASASIRLRSAVARAADGVVDRGALGVSVPAEQAWPWSDVRKAPTSAPLLAS